MVQIDFSSVHSPSPNIVSLKKSSQKLNGDASTYFTAHFFKLVPSNRFEGPQKRDLRFVSVNRRTVRWQRYGVSGMEVHVFKNSIRFFHNQELVLSLQMSMIKTLDKILLAAQKLVIKDLKEVDDVYELAYHFRNCITELVITSRVDINIGVELVKQFPRLRHLECPSGWLSSMVSLKLKSFTIVNINDINDILLTPQHRIFSINIQSPINFSKISLIDQFCYCVSSVVINIFQSNMFSAQSDDFVHNLTRHLPNLKNVMINVTEYQKHITSAEIDCFPDSEVSSHLVNSFVNADIKVELSYNRYIQLNKRSFICYKTAILSDLLHNDSISLKQVNANEEGQQYRAVKKYDNCTVNCNFYFQGLNCCAIHSKYYI